MNDNFQDIITGVVARAPEWIRHDLLSKDHQVRTRAEEAIAAMIASALSIVLNPTESPPAPLEPDPVERKRTAAGAGS